MAAGTSKQAKRVTISDVAREAGVSIAAVSRILNNSYDGFSAREETKQRVFAAVKKLGYRPSRAAVRLATGRHNAIGLCYPVKDSLEAPIDTTSLSQVFTHFDLMLVQHGISRCLKNDNTDLVVMPRHPGRSIPELINQTQETVDGIIWIHPEDDADALDKVVASGVKLAIVGPTPVVGDFVNVRTDETMAGRMAMGHLIVCGARHIMVAIPENRRREQSTVERLEGVGKAVKDFTDPNVKFSTVYLPTDKAAASKELRGYIKKEGKPHGVLTFGDSLPFVILSELAELGLRSPDDFKLVGFEENLTFLLGNPSLSGLRYPIEEMCFQATQKLIEFIKTGEPPKPHYMTPQLIARASCR
ncbi:MAG: LacI family DNA-binding transcriptional regulator [Candidatus Sumerlaeia bacterium]|nr:LacI family DNA-binding transcriptional regulator [Candidatus Sumerlaeia bacterium]